MIEQLLEILKDNNIDPNRKLLTGVTTYEFLEAAVIGALDELEGYAEDLLN
jgi:hypothetical protein